VRRHDTDWLSLSLGGLYVVIAAVHIGTEGTGSSADSLRWFIPATMLVLGVLGLVGATTRGRTPAPATTVGSYPAAPTSPTADTTTVYRSAPAAAEPGAAAGTDDGVAERDEVAEPDEAATPDEVAERDAPADPDDVEHTSRLDDELTVRLDGEQNQPSEPGEPADPAPDGPGQPGKPPADD
jgi:hypothetical protein